MKTDSPSDWGKSLSAALVKDLTGVHDLRLITNYEYNIFNSTFGKNPVNDLLMDSGTKGVARLAFLPLRTVCVSVTGADKWTEKQRQEYAERVKRRLLDPDPAATELRLKEVRDERVKRMIEPRGL